MMKNSYKELVAERLELLNNYKQSEQHCNNPDWGPKRNRLRSEIADVTKRIMEMYDKKKASPIKDVSHSEIRFKIRQTDDGKWRFDIYNREQMLLLEGKALKSPEFIERFIDKLKMNTFSAPVEYINNRNHGKKL